MGIFKTIRTHWKKSVIITCVGIYGFDYGIKKYRDNELRREYCRRAVAFGKLTLGPQEKPKHLTVFLNPAASRGDAAKLWEKNAAPILHLAGFQVSLIRTEKEGEARKYLEVLDSSTDGIIVAGGDGTLSEVLTGLLRRPDAELMRKIPIAALPLGKTNSFARLWSQKEFTSNAASICETAWNVVEWTLKPAHVMKVQPLHSGKEKDVFMLSYIRAGPVRDSENNAHRYWYMGYFRRLMSFFVSSMKDHHNSNMAVGTLSYSPPCDGCSTCISPNKHPKRNWWQSLFLPTVSSTPDPRIEKSNPLCGKDISLSFITPDIKVWGPSSFSSNLIPCVGIEIAPIIKEWYNFTEVGWQSKEDFGRSLIAKGGILPAESFTLILYDNNDKWLTMDNEDYESMSVKVNLLRNHINVFTSVSSLT